MFFRLVFSFIIVGRGSTRRDKLGNESDQTLVFRSKVSFSYELHRPVCHFQSTATTLLSAVLVQSLDSSVAWPHVGNIVPAPPVLSNFLHCHFLMTFNLLRVIKRIKSYLLLLACWFSSPAAAGDAAVAFTAFTCEGARTGAIKARVAFHICRTEGR